MPVCIDVQCVTCVARGKRARSIINYSICICAEIPSSCRYTDDREQNEIHQRAYTSILNGEPLTGVRFRYDYDLESYLLKHMWD